MATWERIVLYSCILLIGIQIGLSTESTTITMLGSPSTTTEWFTSTSTEAPATTTAATNPTTQQTTTLTPTVHCYNGTCTGNVSDDTDYSCINTTITDMCELAASQSCFQTVFKNSSTLIFEVGCRSDCEDIEQEGEGTDTISTTKCCDTHLCNSKHISDPDPENAAVSMTSSMFAIVCLVVFLF